MKTLTVNLIRVFTLLALIGTSVSFGFYDPAAQRWVNRDPIAEHGSANLYGFVANHPLALYDPHGLFIITGPIIVPQDPSPTPPTTPPIVSIPGPLLPGAGQVPPGYDPSWPSGTDARGPFVQDPKTGMRYYPHPEDARHWPHYDNSQGGRYPEKCVKPWPNQTRPPYGNQSPKNPWPTPPWWKNIPWEDIPIWIRNLPIPIPVYVPIWEDPHYGRPGGSPPVA